MRNYANAQDVLPQELLSKLKEHFSGGELYISQGKSAKEKRNLVIALAKQNTPTAEIATIVGLTTRRVNQILAGRRRHKIEWEWKG